MRDPDARGHAGRGLVRSGRRADAADRGRAGADHAGLEVHPRRGAQGVRGLRQGEVERHREGQRDPGRHAGRVRAHRRVEGTARGRHLLGRRVGAVRDSRREEAPAKGGDRQRRVGLDPRLDRDAQADPAQGQGRQLGRHGTGAVWARLSPAEDPAPRPRRAEGMGRSLEPQAQGRGRTVRAHAVLVVERDVRGDPVDARRGQGLGLAAQACRQHRALHRAQPRRADRRGQGRVHRGLRGAVLHGVRGEAGRVRSEVRRAQERLRHTRAHGDSRWRPQSEGRPRVHRVPPERARPARVHGARPLPDHAQVQGAGPAGRDGRRVHRRRALLLRPRRLERLRRGGRAEALRRAQAEVPDGHRSNLEEALKIRLHDLKKRYGSVTAVDGASLDIGDGELFTLLGPSGCGKTTLLRLMAGFSRPDGGQIWFGERRVDALRAYERNIGMVFQNYALWPHMTVQANVAYGLKLRKLAAGAIAERVAAGLAKVNLTGLELRYPGQLSGGQQQRVALARALVLNPDILLLDEPLSNLDAKIRVQVRAEIRKLQKELGITTVYVTHDQEEALSLSDRVAVMREGRILQISTPKELYERPAGRFVADFVGTNNFLTGTCREIRADRICAETAIGLVRAWPSPGIVRGDRCVLAIRPENIALGTAHENTFAGRIVLASYLGSTLRYDVEMRGGVVLKVDVGDPWHHEVLPLRAAVHVTFPASAALTLADE